MDLIRTYQSDIFYNGISNVLEELQDHYIIFDTLTCYSYINSTDLFKKGAFWGYMNTVKESVPSGSYHCIARMERNRSNPNRFHMHALHFLEDLPLNCDEAIIEGRDYIVRGFKRFWYGGPSYPKAVRYNGDMWERRLGWEKECYGNIYRSVLNIFKYMEKQKDTFYKKPVEKFIFPKPVVDVPVVKYKKDERDIDMTEKEVSKKEVSNTESLWDFISFILIGGTALMFLLKMAV